MVYVQDINGKPMMPTTRHGKVRRLLKENKAVVVSLCPFTIKLTYVTSDYKQEAVLTFVILMAKAKRISRTRNLNYQGVSVL